MRQKYLIDDKRVSRVEYFKHNAKEYHFVCQVCGKPFITHHPQAKACKNHQQEYRKQHQNERNAMRYAIYKANKDYLNR